MRASSVGRVLMLLENNPYPQDGRVRREATTLVRAGYGVSVIAPRAPGQAWRETLEGVTVLRFPAVHGAEGFLGYLAEYGAAMAGAFVLMLWVWLATGFDVVHAHNPPDAFVVVAAPFLALGKRFVFDHHDLAPEMYRARFGAAARGPVHRALLGLERLSLRAAARVIATNESYKRVEQDRAGVPASRITVVRNGPDLARVAATAPDPSLRARASTIIGFAGSMGYQDGLDTLLRSLAILRGDLGRDDFFAVLVGAGDALPELRRLQRELGLEDRVWFAGYRNAPELMRYLSTADICVEPAPANAYNDRSTTIKVMEYMALSKPTVAYDLPETRVSARDAALYAAPNDETDFARKLAVLMDDAGLREALGRSGRRRVETELSWERQEGHLLRAYELLAAPPVRARAVRG